MKSAFGLGENVKAEPTQLVRYEISVRAALDVVR